MEIIENSLIPIMEDKKGEKLVNARDLHSFLEVGRDFTTWIKDRIDKYQFIENEDYSSLTEIGEREIGATTRTEYILTLSTAKEIAMVENNEKGKQVRRYFIEIEKKYNNEILELQQEAYVRIALLERRLKIYESRIALPVSISKYEIDVIKIINLINDLAGDGEIYNNIHYKVRKFYDNEKEYLFIDFRKVYKILKSEYKEIQMFKASPLTIEKAFNKYDFCLEVSIIDKLLNQKSYDMSAVSGLLLDIVKLKEAGANIDNLY
ncbi:antA/AntB antirepressor family protein [Clostridium sp.]|uniref:antA/AntB antirepressor family protein n=1 Tax=Clostridium sp. TaxID=1506 RepID=UPI0026041DAD|nr:antA/AntB antirepressor family protein [Clostridium sp.]